MCRAGCSCRSTALRNPPVRIFVSFSLILNRPVRDGFLFELFIAIKNEKRHTKRLAVDFCAIYNSAKGLLQHTIFSGKLGEK